VRCRAYYLQILDYATGTCLTRQNIDGQMASMIHDPCLLFLIAALVLMPGQLTSMHQGGPTRSATNARILQRVQPRAADSTNRMDGWIWMVDKGGVFGYWQNLLSPAPHTQTKKFRPIQTLCTPSTYWQLVRGLRELY
jgi:hypothetical protein